MHQQYPHEWSIELLRGFAALLVVYAHYYPLAGLEPGLLGFTFTGVDLFFVLSGFVFAPYFFGRPLQIRAHGVRRFFRLYPLYAVALGVYAWLRWQPDVSGMVLLKHALFLHTLESREIAAHFNSAFWSLPPEVEFYLLLPLLAAITGTWRRVVALTLGALVMHLVIAWQAPPAPAIDFFTVASAHLPGLLVEFMFGVVTWRLVSQSPGRALRWALAIAGVLGWCALAGTFATLGDAGVERIEWLRGNMSLLAAVTFAMLVCAWVGSVPRPGQWLVWISSQSGKLSYGMYLFHNAVPLMLRDFQGAMSGPWFALLCFGLTLLIAWVLNRTVEEPCRRWGRRLA